MYQATLEPAPTGELTPVEEGGVIYKSAACSGCHGAGRRRAAPASPPSTGVLETWPDFRDHMMWVRLGIGRAGASSPTPTAPPTSRSAAAMPAHAALDDEELALVVLYERVEFGGLEEGSEEYALLLEIAEGQTTFAEAGLGDVSTAVGVPEDDLGPG